MSNHLQLVPAYGRKYANGAEALNDWNADKDFRVMDTGQYINKADFRTYSEIKSCEIFIGSGLPTVKIGR